jgi:MYXO-CTERM domain-containing protein
MTIGYADCNLYTMQFDLAGTDAGRTYDQLAVLDHLFLNTGLEVRIAGFGPTPGDQFTIIDNRFSGPVGGTFYNLPEGSTLLAAGTPMRISYLGGDGNDVVLTVVPEPAGLGVITLAGLLLGRRRSRVG